MAGHTYGISVRVPWKEERPVLDEGSVILPEPNEQQSETLKDWERQERLAEKPEGHVLPRRPTSRQHCLSRLKKQKKPCYSKSFSD